MFQWGANSTQPDATGPMRLLFLDDSRQRSCNRPRVGALVAVGGLIVEDRAVRDLERAIDALCCNDFGFPAGEPFKWSPARDHWMRAHLISGQREEFFRQVLRKTAEFGAVGQVTISDTSRGLATGRAQNHEMDVLVMALERFDRSLSGTDLGMVIVARPSGGRVDEDTFLSGCVDIVTGGTDYTAFQRIASNVLTMPSANSRILQAADLVVSITTAMIAGHTEFAGNVFPDVKSLLRSNAGRIGGIGVKIHPDYVFANLYHWVLGDGAFCRMLANTSLPMPSRPFFNGPDVF